jgi:hypothetical protein
MVQWGWAGTAQGGGEAIKFYTAIPISPASFNRQLVCQKHTEGIIKIYPLPHSNKEDTIQTHIHTQTHYTYMHSRNLLEMENLLAIDVQLFRVQSQQIFVHRNANVRKLETREEDIFIGAKIRNQN